MRVRIASPAIPAGRFISGHPVPTSPPARYPRVSPAPLFKILPPEAIDHDDTTYLLRPPPLEAPGKELVASIAEHGILQPPLLLDRQEGRATVLSGRQRIAAAIRLGLAGIPVLLVPAATPVLQRMELLVEHARMGSELSIIEQATLMARAEQWLTEKECLSLLARLGHRPQLHLLRQLTSLLTLDDSVVMALHRRLLHPRTGHRLARLRAEDQRELVKRITSLRLGGSKQQKLVDLATELAMRRQQPLREIFAEMEETGDRKNDRNIPQQAAALLQWLHEQCFPRSEAAAAEFRRFRRNLDLPAGVRLRHTPAFEDDRLTLEIDFRDRRDLENRWPLLRKALE